MDWWRTLKVGDLVCTCRYEHRQITKIEDVTEAKNDVAHMLPIMMAMVCVPVGALLWWVIQKKAATIVVDRIVYFSDGATCHATLCLTDPANCTHE